MNRSFVFYRDSHPFFTVVVWNYPQKNSNLR